VIAQSSPITNSTAGSSTTAAGGGGAAATRTVVAAGAVVVVVVAVALCDDDDDDDEGATAGVDAEPLPPPVVPTRTRVRRLEFEYKRSTVAVSVPARKAVLHHEALMAARSSSHIFWMAFSMRSTYES